MFSSRDGQPVHLGKPWGNSAAFLVCSGPSLLSHDLRLLGERGVLSCAVNNAATVIRPQLWVCGDDPGNFCDAIWRDPAIWKFTPLENLTKQIMVRDAQSRLIPSIEFVHDMPAVFGFRRNEIFQAERWLTEETFNWGNHAKTYDAAGHRGSRSVMYLALKLLYVLGFRRVYLLGCDFRMELGQQNYAFEQARSADSVRGNNKSYLVLNSRLAMLKPHFDAAGFQVFNCTPDSGLTVFPYVPYERAIQDALKNFPKRILTEGMYDRAARERAVQAIPDNSTSEAIDAYEVTEDKTGSRPNDALSPIDFTTVVAIDAQHVEELKRTWPTWKANRPEILQQPLLIICDGDLATNHWHERLEFVDHPHKRLVPWNMPGVSQREKMLSAFVFVPGQEVTTPWYLKLDTDTVAASPSPWLRAEWFAADTRGKKPVLVAHPWGYTKPADALSKLDAWADTVSEMRRYSRLDIPFAPGSRLVRSPRIISWCCFGNTAWTRRMAELCDGRLPVPSQDTFLWYCAARRGDLVRRISMKPQWNHTKNRADHRSDPRLRNAPSAGRVEQLTFSGLSAAIAPTKASSSTAADSRTASERGVIYLLTGAGHGVRLAVSLHSLRTFYDGPVTIFTTREESHRLGEKFHNDVRLRIHHRRIEEFSSPGKNSSFLTKVKCLSESPYATTLFLDADTLVTGPLDALFEGAEEKSLCVTQLANWSTRQRIIRKRIESWRDVVPPGVSPAEFQVWVAEALQNQPAINIGAFAYQRGAAVLPLWFAVAQAGWHKFICDEVSLQILLPRCPHQLLDCRYNYSPSLPHEVRDVRLWHFHGKKHVRAGKARDAWLPAYRACLNENIAQIQSWTPAGDKRLEGYLRSIVAVSTAHPRT